MSDTPAPRKLNVLPLYQEKEEEKNPDSAVKLGRFPAWLHRKLPQEALFLKREPF
jgi:hypothetical protein